jgi:hypothetical protein
MVSTMKKLFPLSFEREKERERERKMIYLINRSFPLLEIKK